MELIKINKIEVNKGQIEGLPKNPRFVRDDKFKKLVKSIEDNPEMLEYRELLVYPHKGKYVVIGGNMRLRACKELGYKEVPCKVLPQDATIEQLKAYTIKDNNGYGEWDFDLLANEWECDLLDEWGVDLPVQVDIEDTPDIEEEEIQNNYRISYEIVFNNEDEQNVFYELLRELKNGIQLDTISERIIEALKFWKNNYE